MGVCTFVAGSMGVAGGVFFIAAGFALSFSDLFSPGCVPAGVAKCALGVAQPDGRCVSPGPDWVQDVAVLFFGLVDVGAV
ncbi:MAG TPA: hypothetical protein VG867_05920 [Rhizomicrobium sp.]|nr:hypothetical protein [Rhizomicrobium sp.]